MLATSVGMSAWGRRAALVSLATLAAACSGSTPRPPDPPPAGPVLGVRLVEPNGELTVLAGEVVPLRAVFTLGALEVDPDSVVWRSSVQGELSRTAASDGVALVQGEHVIRVEASSGTASGFAEAKVTAGFVGVRITRPQAGAHLRPGVAVTLGAAGVGLDQGTRVQLVSSSSPTASQRTAQFSWTSTVNGYLGAADTVRLAVPAPGRHHLRVDLAYADASQGTLIASAGVDVVVDTAPVVGFDAPACDGTAVVEAGSAVNLVAHASDAEDGPLAGGFVDLLTFETHAGSGWDFASSVVGMHPVAFEATDALGETTSTVCPVLVVPPAGGAGDVFPALDAVNTALPAGGDVRFVGGDGEGRLLVGVVGGLVVVDAAGVPSALYGAAELGLDGTPTVGGAVVSGGRVLLGTASGVVECDWLGGAPSGCVIVDVHAAGAVALDGDLAGSGVMAVAGPLGIVVGAVDGGVLTTHFFARSSMSTGGTPHAVAFGRGALFVATGGGLCVIHAPAALASPGASPPFCDEAVNQATSVLGTSALRSLAVAGDALWIGSAAGLGRYDLTTGKTAHLGVDAGLADPLVESLAVDGTGGLWLGTAAGLDRIDLGTLRVTAMRPPGWTGSPEVRSVHAEGGRVWVGTAFGLRLYAGR